MSDKVEFIALSEKYFQNLYFCQALDQRERVVYIYFNCKEAALEGQMLSGSLCVSVPKTEFHLSSFKPKT